MSTLAEPRVACDHCGLTVPAGLIDRSSDAQFCCAGCEAAYETIRGLGLEDYYAFRDRFADKPQRASGRGKRYAAFDSSAFLERNTTAASSGFLAIDLQLEGVHCAACVWLVEKLPSVVGGVIESRLSLATGRARVVWDPRRTPLSAVAIALDRMGYAPHPARDRETRSARDRAERDRLVRLGIAGALAGNNMLISLALYAGAFEGIEPRFAELFRWLSMAIGALSLAWPGRGFFASALAAARARAPSLDLPISLALAVGGAAGATNVLLGRGEIYFDSLSTLVFLLLVGRYFQAKQQRWAEEAVGSMLSLTPDECRVVRDGRVVEDSVDALQSGDEVEVRPGELFPADGFVTRGESAVDQALLTGETLPAPVARGDAVYAGAQNVATTLRVRVNKVGAETRVGRLSRLVEEGLAAKPPIVEFADRVAGWFVAVVVLLAGANLVWWAASRGVAPAIDSTVALLIVACPCALGLATPLTMAVGLGRSSKRGMLVKSAAALQRLAGVGRGAAGRMILDKTGTLTTRELRVEGWTGDDRLRRWVAALEAESNHPVAASLREAFGPTDPSDAALLTDRAEKHGYGLRARTPIGDLVVGSMRYAEDLGCVLDSAAADSARKGRAQGYTVVAVALDGRVEGIAWLRDEVHQRCRENLDALRRGGWRCEILSGDEPGAARRVAALIGLDPETLALGGVSPEGKLAHVREAQRDSRAATVVMVGDGVNDAASLAAADVGVAAHGGAEASLAAADVYLAEPGIDKLVELVGLSRATMRVVRRNLAISLLYNAAAAGMAIAGLITPLVAALLMPASSATVLASAVSLGRTAPSPKDSPRS